MSVGDALGDAWEVYRLLLRRSVVAAAIVYVAVDGVSAAGHFTDSGSARVAVRFADAILGFAGPVLVQGALVTIVRSLHEGRAPERIPTLFAQVFRHVWRLLGASLLYGIGIVLGLIALIVPGLLVIARWSLMAPIIMLEDERVMQSNYRSSRLVRGATGAVLAALVIAFVVVAVPTTAWEYARVGFTAHVVGSFIWACLTAPFAAHLLSVIYYKRTEPERPVIDPVVGIVAVGLAGRLGHSP